MGDNGHTEAVKPEVVVGYIERIERLNKEMASLSADRSEVFKEAKEAGLSTKAMREVIRWRKLDAEARDSLRDTIDLYMQAMGAFITTPLGQAGMPKNGAAPSPQP